LFVARYDKKGRLMFARQTAGTGSAGGNAIAAAPDGGVYVAGDIYGTATYGPGEHGQTDLTELPAGDGYHYGDAFIAKYQSNGTLEWVRQVSGSEDDEVKSIAVADDGGLFVTGYFDSTATFDGGTTGPIILTSQSGYYEESDMFIAKYQSDGALG
jgi:hypothetical protein